MGIREPEPEQDSVVLIHRSCICRLVKLCSKYTTNSISNPYWMAVAAYGSADC